MKDTSEILSERFSVRFTYDEKELIKYLAEEHGMKPTALIRDVVRQCLLSQEVEKLGNELGKGNLD